MNSKPVLKLDWCSHAAAKYAVEHWHYSGSLPTPPLVKVGVWEDEQYIGCVLFSRGANNNIGKAFGLASTQVAELTRVALTDHQTPVSRIIRVAIAFLGKQSPNLRLIVSYADPSQQHHGGIYQAGNWTYIGQSPPSVEYLAPDGKQWHGRMVSASGRTQVYGQTRSVWRHDQCTPVTVAGKHKYLYPLDDAMREQIAPLAKPYPKRPRAGSVDGDTLAVHAGEGGSIPTPALHRADDPISTENPHVLP
jgi:hypothetical protein